MAEQKKRNNHYVPQWYQQGFLPPGQTNLFYLDLFPNTIQLSSGKTFQDKALRVWGTRKCFCERDIYTTFFPDGLNDDIETYLFGDIDRRGANAVRAFVEGELNEMHIAFADFFEYIDAQKLRTPKGLDWIRSCYPEMDQIQLMREMQGLRMMHRAMWSEGVREIVSAQDSDVKFIISDHPITIYNAACPPSSDHCRYPQDPFVEQLGSQTVFVLNAETCLILTHLEYATAPRIKDLRGFRTNARSFGNSLVRTDAYIRNRKLNRDQVSAINYLLRARARRFIAASDQSWLQPAYTGKWEEIADVLRPRDELWRFGGNILVGYKDGSSHYQDAFGRSSADDSYLRWQDPPQNVGPNDSCGCRSGKKFKYCCQLLSPEDRPSWTLRGIRIRNLMFSDKVRELLGISAGKTWKDVRQELDDDQVMRIHETYSALWPEDTNFAELLPRPSDKVLRAIYLGPLDPRTVAVTVISWLAYFDEIVVPHPFMNAHRMMPQYSPISSPSKHKGNTLRNVLVLLMLEPFVEAGLIHLVPDPGEFNGDFARIAVNMAKERVDDWTPDDQDTIVHRRLGHDDFLRAMSQLPESSLRAQLRRHSPHEITEEELNAMVKLMKDRLAEDPLALLQPIVPGDDGAQLYSIKSYTIETGMFLSQFTGSVIYTDQPALWKQLHWHTSANKSGTPLERKMILAAMHKLALPIELDPAVQLKARWEGRFGTFRADVRQVFNLLRCDIPVEQTQNLVDRLGKSEMNMRREWRSIKNGVRREASLIVSAPSGGFMRGDIQRLLILFGRVRERRSTPIGIFISYDIELIPDGSI